MYFPANMPGCPDHPGQPFNVSWANNKTTCTCSICQRVLYSGEGVAVGGVSFMIDASKIPSHDEVLSDYAQRQFWIKHEQVVVKSERQAEIEQRLKDAAPVNDWEMKQSQHYQIDIYDGITRIASVYNRDNARLLTHAPDDLKWALATIHNKDVVLEAYRSEHETLDKLVKAVQAGHWNEAARLANEVKG